MAKSIIQNDKECYVTRSTLGLHEHHIFGGPNRKKSEKYGLKIWLIHELHNSTSKGIHFDKNFDIRIKKMAQKRFNEVYPNLKFIDIFNKNYL